LFTKKVKNWQIFFLLAGMIPLGIAMHNRGDSLGLQTNYGFPGQGQSEK